MKTVLILAEYFPPAFSIGGKRPYRFARYLPEHGWRPVVVTKKAPEAQRQDPTPHPLPEHAVLSRTLLPSWWKEGKGKPADGTTAKPTTARQKDASWPVKLKNQFQFPFSKKRLFQSGMAKNVARMAQEYEADAIFSTSSPYEMLTLGVAAKKATGLPLILDLRDPWSLNFLLRDKPAHYMRSIKRTERRCLAEADRVTFTCKEAAEAYRAEYPELPQGHIRTIYNSFDPALKPEESMIASSPTIDLMHFGNCYGPRRLETIIRAIHMLRSRPVPGADKLRIVNLGRPAQADLDLLTELKIEDTLSWEPFVPYEQGLKRLAGASAQILMAYGNETLYVPAKVFDYFLTGRPILCLSASSELRHMVEGTGSGLTAEPTDVASVAQMLERIIDGRAKDTPVCQPNQTLIDEFSAPHTAGQLAGLLNEIVA